MKNAPAQPEKPAVNPAQAAACVAAVWSLIETWYERDPARRAMIDEIIAECRREEEAAADLPKAA